MGWCSLHGVWLGDVLEDHLPTTSGLVLHHLDAMASLTLLGKVGSKAGRCHLILGEMGGLGMKERDHT